MKTSKQSLGKCHEMFKSRLQSRHWSHRLSSWVVQQTSLLFKTLPRRLRDGCSEATTKAEHDDLLRVAFRTTDFERAAEAGAGRHSDSFKALLSMSLLFWRRRRAP